MAYARRYVGGFVDLPTQTTAIDSVFLNAVESALLTLFDANPGSAGMVQVWNGAKFAPKLLTNAEIDPAAAISKTKLGALAIVDADVAGIAAIALSKLAPTGTIGTSPISLAAAGKTALQIADSGAQLSGVTIGGDTNLYRSAAGLLGSDTDVEARLGSAYRIRIGFVSTPNAPGIQMGSTYDTNLYRSAANTLKSDGVLQADLKTLTASVTTARTGGAASALPANPVRYLAVLDENGNRMYIPAYS